MNDCGDFSIDIGRGFQIDMNMKVCTACPKKDAELYKKELESGNNELMSTDD
jgi:hypothetical protein